MFGYLLTSGLLQYATQCGHFILQRPLANLLRQPRLNVAFNMAYPDLRHPLDLDIQRASMAAEPLHNMNAVIHRFKTAASPFRQRLHFTA